MGEEKNNIGVNSINSGTNGLPPMGTFPADNSNNNSTNVQERYGLPPIENFTNFNDSYVTPKPSTDVSVFDLMNQFENVNKDGVVGNNVQPINAIPNSNIVNDIPNNYQSSSSNEPNNFVNNSSQVSSVVPNIQPSNVVSTPQNTETPNIEVPKETPVVNNTQVIPNIQPSNVVSTPQNIETQNVEVPKQNPVVDSTQAVPDIQPSNVIDTAQNIEEISKSEDGDAQTLASDSLDATIDDSFIAQALKTSDDFNNLEVEKSLDNNNSYIEIPTVSSVYDDESQNIIPDALENGSSNDNIVNNESISDEKKELLNDKKKVKKKKGKKVFIILLIITLLLLAIAVVLAYFMFFKRDKLVCSYEDYSNDELMSEDSFVARFIGNNIDTIKSNKKVTMYEEYIDKKDVYLEDTKNMYQGMGFDISFSSDEEGYEIGMNLTKKEFEELYGVSIKNYSKAKLKKEMQEAGYTCK